MSCKAGKVIMVDCLKNSFGERLWYIINIMDYEDARYTIFSYGWSKSWFRATLLYVWNLLYAVLSHCYIIRSDLNPPAMWTTLTSACVQVEKTIYWLWTHTVQDTLDEQRTQHHHLLLAFKHNIVYSDKHVLNPRTTDPSQSSKISEKRKLLQFWQTAVWFP